MAHTYACCHYHVVFSTRERRGQIVPQFCERLHEYMAAIARRNGAEALRVGGARDHVHLLLAVPPRLSVSQVVQLVKGGSSRFVHETFPRAATFAWQEGYGVFTVSASQVDSAIAYIERQEEHHRSSTFEDEFRALLKKHGIAWDERYVWG